MNCKDFLEFFECRHWIAAEQRFCFDTTNPLLLVVSSYGDLTNKLLIKKVVPPFPPEAYKLELKNATVVFLKIL